MDMLTLLSVLHQLPDHDGVQITADDDTGPPGTTDAAREFCCPACAILWANETSAVHMNHVTGAHSIKHMARTPTGFPCWMKFSCTKSTSSR